MKFGQDYQDQLKTLTSVDVQNANSMNSIGEAKDLVETPADRAKEIVAQKASEATTSAATTKKSQYSISDLLDGKSPAQQDKDNKPSTVGTILKNVQVGLGKGVDALAHPIDTAEVLYDTVKYDSNVTASNDRIRKYNLAMKEMARTGATTYQGLTASQWKNTLNDNALNEAKSEYWYKEGAKDTKDLASKSILTDEQQAKIAQVEEDTTKLGGVGQFFAGLAQSAGAMAPSILTGSVAGGLAASEVVGSAVGLGTMWGEVYGRDLKDLSNQGYDWTDASEKAFLDACVEVGTEALVGGTPGMRAGVFDNAIKEPVSKAVTALTSKFGNKLIAKAGTEGAGQFISAAGASIGNMFVNGSFGEFFAEALGEGAEEMASALLEPYVDRATINPDAENASVGDVLLQGLGGAIMGVFFNLSSLSFQKATEEGKAVVPNGNGGYKLLPAPELTQEVLSLPEGDLKYLNGPQVTVGEDGIMYGTGAVADTIPEEIGNGKKVKVGKNPKATPVQVQGVDGESFKAFKIGKDYFLDKSGKVRVEDGATILNRDGSKKSTYRWSEETAKTKTKSKPFNEEQLKEIEELLKNAEPAPAEFGGVPTADAAKFMGISTDELLGYNEKLTKWIELKISEDFETWKNATPEEAERISRNNAKEFADFISGKFRGENKPTDVDGTTGVKESPTTNGYINVNQPDAVYRNNVRAAVIMVNKMIDGGIFDSNLGNILGLNESDIAKYQSVLQNDKIGVVGLRNAYYPNQGLRYTNTLTLEDVKNYIDSKVVPAFEAMLNAYNEDPKTWKSRLRNGNKQIRVEQNINGHSIPVPMDASHYREFRKNQGATSEGKIEAEFNKIYEKQYKALNNYVSKLGKTLKKFGLNIKIDETLDSNAAFSPNRATIFINPNSCNNELATKISIAHELIHAIQHLETGGDYSHGPYKLPEGGVRVKSLRDLRDAYRSALQDLGVDVDSWEEQWDKVYTPARFDFAAWFIARNNQGAYIKSRQEDEYEAKIIASILQSPEALFELMQTNAGREGLYPALKGFISGLIEQETEPEVIDQEREILKEIDTAKKEAEAITESKPGEEIIEVVAGTEGPSVEEIFLLKGEKAKRDESKKSSSKKKATPTEQVLSDEYSVKLGKDSTLNGLKMSYNETEGWVEIVRPKDGTLRSVRSLQNKELHKLGFVPIEIPKLDTNGNPIVGEDGAVIYTHSDTWHSTGDARLVWTNLGGPDIGIGEVAKTDKAKTDKAKTTKKTKTKPDTTMNEPVKKTARTQIKEFAKGIVGKLKQYEVSGSDTMTKMLSDVNGLDEIWIAPNGYRLNARQKQDLDILGFTYDRNYKIYKAKYDADLWEATGGEQLTLEELKKANSDYAEMLAAEGAGYVGEAQGPETSKEKILVKYKGDPEYHVYGAATYKSFIQEIKDGIKRGNEVEIEAIIDKTTGDEIFNSSKPKDYVKPADYYDVKLAVPYKYLSDGTRANINPERYVDDTYEAYIEKKKQEENERFGGLRDFNPEGFVEKGVKTYTMTPEELVEWKKKYAIINSEFVINNPEIINTDSPYKLQALFDEYINGGYDEANIFSSNVIQDDSLDNQWKMAGDTYGVQDETTGTPNRPDSQRKNSKVAGHMMEDEELTPQMRMNLQQSILAGEMSYIPRTNSEIEKKARTWLNRKEFRKADGSFDLSKALDRYVAKAEEGVSSPEEIAQGFLLLAQFKNLALQRQAQGKQLTDGELKAWQKLRILVEVNGNSIATALQFYRQLNKLTGDGRVYYIEKEFEAFRRDLQKKTNIFEKKASGALDDYTIPENLLNNLRNATTEEAVLKAEDLIKEDIAKRIPATIGSRAAAWRYLSMLGNVRTHERNVISNAAMWLARNVRDYSDALLEDIFLSKDQYERNNTLKKKASKEIKAIAKEQWLKHKADIMAGGKLGFSADIYQRAAQFGSSKGGRFLEGLSRKNSDLLELEDSWFLQATFRQAFEQYVVANESRWLKNAPEGMTLEEFLNSSGTNAMAAEAFNKALEKARLEAWRATYREADDLSTWLNHQSNKGGWQKLIIEGIMPFKRTPINILKQGLRYSPYGIYNGLTELYKISRGIEVKDATTKAPKTMADAITDLCAGMTGTMILGLGIFLSGAGAMKAGGSDNDKEEYYDEMLGNQKYSVNVFGQNITLDWLTPLSMPLFAGVTIGDAIFNDDVADDDDTNYYADFNNILGALTHMADPYTNLSLLSGVNDALNSYSDDKLGEAVTSAASSYVAQYLPTLGGQVARSIDGVRRTTYAEKDVDMIGGQKMAKFINKLKAKIPFLSQTNEEYVDMWGRTEESGGLISQALTPWYAKQTNVTEVDDKLAEVFEATKDTSVLPATPQSYYTISEEKYYLDPADYTQVKKTAGTLSYNGVKSVFDSNLYDQLTTDQQADAITAVYTYAKEVAKYDYTSANEIAYDKKSTITNVDKALEVGLSVGDYFVIKQLLSDDAAGTKNAQKKAIGQSLGLSSAQIDIFLKH